MRDYSKLNSERRRSAYSSHSATSGRGNENAQTPTTATKERPPPAAQNFTTEIAQITSPVPPPPVVRAKTPDTAVVHASRVEVGGTDIISDMTKRSAMERIDFILEQYNPTEKESALIDAIWDRRITYA